MKSNAILLASIKWWKDRRPRGWTSEQHLAQPTVNCRGIPEHELAEAVAAALKEKETT